MGRRWGASIGVCGALWGGACGPGEAAGPSGCASEVGELGGNVGADGGLKVDNVLQNAEGILAHFLASEELGWFECEVQAELDCLVLAGPRVTLTDPDKAVLSLGHNLVGASTLAGTWEGRGGAAPGQELLAERSELGTELLLP
jgi:hypothetical protein